MSKNKRRYNPYDHETQKVLVCRRQCRTCIYGPNWPGDGLDTATHMEEKAIRLKSAIACHSTYPPIGPGDGKAAVCHGFYINNRQAWYLVVFAKVFGVTMVDPPK